MKEDILLANKFWQIKNQARTGLSQESPVYVLFYLYLKTLFLLACNFLLVVPNAYLQRRTPYHPGITFELKPELAWQNRCLA
ncbi:MAG: hypothetical protein RBQ99_09365 [Trichlorobacter sp.]|jgi:hypothetical protein|nr:hypothetical protein [Trichlorobacter sp.]